MLCFGKYYLNFSQQALFEARTNGSKVFSLCFSIIPHNRIYFLLLPSPCQSSLQLSWQASYCLRALGFRRLHILGLLQVSAMQLLNSLRLLPVSKLDSSGQHVTTLLVVPMPPLVIFLRLLTCLPLSNKNFFLLAFQLALICSLSIHLYAKKPHPTLPITDLPVKPLAV